MSKKIMIVEDNELNMKLFRDLIQVLGYETVELTSGVNAIEHIQQEKPDLILMDIQLPGMSGVDLTKHLKKDPQLASIPIIAITAFALKTEEEHILQSGCEAYLSKPIAVPVFLATVKKYLGE